MKVSKCMLAALCVTGLLSMQLTAQEPENGHKKTVVVHTGKIVTFEKADPAFVVVKTDKAEINAELAPMSFIEENKLVFTPAEEITVKGYETTRDGKRIFVVTEVTTKDRRIVKFRGDDMNPVWTKVTTTTDKPADLVVYTGKVKTFEKMDPAMVFVTTDKGEIRAELAPVSFLDQNKLMFAPEDDITIKGFETMRDGKRIFIVTEVTTKDRRIVKFRGENRSPVWVKVTADKPTEMRDITGSVTVVETVDTPDGRLVTIKGDAGERVIALGPGSYLEKNRYEFKNGDKIVVHGYEVERDGKRVFLAMNVKKGDIVWKFRRHDGTVLWNE